MKKLLIISLFISFFGFSQQEKSPFFESCKDQNIQQMESCFLDTLKQEIQAKIKIPDVVQRGNFQGNVRILFNVTPKGEFDIVYVNAPYTELKTEIHRVFKTLPKVKPATYNGRPINKQYVYNLQIPLINSLENKQDSIVEPSKIENQGKKDIRLNDLTSNGLFPEHKSPLLIPFTHTEYDFIQSDILKHNNQHTAVKPYVFNEVSEVVNLDSIKTNLLKPATNWWVKKIWNEHFFMVKGKKDDIPYWFTVDPEMDLQIGKDNSDLNYTYNNTRAVRIQGAIGGKFGFSASIYESQGRFADYINNYNNANGIVIGRGKFKRFKEDAFDYPVAEAYISYSPNKIFNFQFGQGKNFIGNGYRSLFLSDVASPYPYLKISTTFWKIKYTNIWLFTDDIRPDAQINGENLRKYVGMHHLSYNVNDRLNISLFESVIGNNENGNGFDISYFNPIILYRAAEFNKGSKAGNALVGLSSSYKLKENIFLYTQFLLDEMTIAQLKANTGYWANKFGFQAGFKYFNAFGVQNFMLQGEGNLVRPFTYSHRKVTLNYGHFNQPMAHPWGANFYELIGIARYKKDRWFGNAKLIYGKKGFDIEGDSVSYGGDIYISYNERATDFDNTIAQGNTTNIFTGEFQAGYLINPSTNLKLFGGLVYRNFSPTIESANFISRNDTWFSFGLKTDVFNWYTDF